MALLRRVATVGGWTLVSRVLGLVRDRLLAHAFGGSLLLDSFFVAFQLPNLLRNLFGEGALSAAFVPRYVRLRSGDSTEGEAFAGLVLTRLALLLSLVAALGMIAAGVVAAWADVATATVALLALPQLPYMVFICVSAVAAGALNARRHFWVPAAAPVLLNLVLIASILLFRHVTVLPYAVLATGILQVAAHLIALRHTGGVPPAALRSTVALRELRRALAPTLVSSGVYQLNALLDSLIAYVCITRLQSDGAGAVTVLYFANRLLQFPMALVGHATHTALYPDLAAAAEGGYAASGAILRRGSALLAFWLLPASIGLLVVADPLARTIYQTGAFGPEEAGRTVLAARFCALALLPFSLNKLLVRVFLAHLDQRLPMRVSLVMVAINLGLNLILVQTPLREAGLALASALSGSAACTIYAVVLYRRGCGRVLAARAVWWPFLAALVMGAAVAALLAWWGKETTPIGHASRLAAATGGGAAIYALLTYPVLRRLRRRPSE